MRKYLLHILIISFVFLLTPTVQVASYAGAIEDAKEVVRNNPDDAIAHYNLGYKYVLSNDRDSALEQYKILKKLDTKKAKMLLDYIDKHTQP